MPRKRRFPKRLPPTPQGLEGVTLAERSLWAARGPLLEADLDDDPPDGYSVWESWNAFFQFYETVRDELWTRHPWLRERSATERLFIAWKAGADLNLERAALAAEREANDPRWNIEPD